LNALLRLKPDPVFLMRLDAPLCTFAFGIALTPH
jgi:hypothetical protein